VLVACNVSLADERLLHTRLDLLPLAVRAMADGSPTLILVGEAVGQGRQHPVARSAIAEHIIDLR
jgi:uroporphyrin-III C-methyltransferase